MYFFIEQSNFVWDYYFKTKLINRIPMDYILENKNYLLRDFRTEHELLLEAEKAKDLANTLQQYFDRILANSLC